MNDTIDYYNKNSTEFFSSTCDVIFKENQDKFLHLLASNAHILDFGCGSGRDSKYFFDYGYNVEAWDGSKALCQLASEYTGIKVQNKLFSELISEQEYDGIWACSSILHLPINELQDVLISIEKALKNKGILYTSFKYGEFSGLRNGRYFTDMTEASFEKLLPSIPQMKIVEMWITGDVRPNRSEEKWLNLLLQKI